jgi:hypothetical protein
LQTYDNGIASMLDMPIVDNTNVLVNYIGVTKNILKFDYGPMHTPIIIFKCEWMKSKDNQGNLTYVRDDVGFFIMYFLHKLPLMFEPFINFPTQAT